MAAADFWDDACWDVLNDVASYTSRVRERRKRAASEAAAGMAAAAAPRSRKKRAKEMHKRIVVNPDAEPGSVESRRNDPTTCKWLKLMQRRGVREPGTRAYYKFRNKFRLPLTEVERLVEMGQAVPAFKDKPSGPGNGRGHPRFPLIIKVLAALRCLAKGCDVDCVEEAACCSAPMLAWFVPAFFEWMSEVVYPLVVKLPEGEHLEGSLFGMRGLVSPGRIAKQTASTSIGRHARPSCMACTKAKRSTHRWPSMRRYCTPRRSSTSGSKVRSGV